MKPFHVVAAALAATSMWVAAAESTSKLPEPWYILGPGGGAASPRFQSGIDHLVTSSGKGSKFLRYTKGEAKTGQTEAPLFASLEQEISAKRYAGQRIRFQARVKTRDVKSAGLFMTVSEGVLLLDLCTCRDKEIAGTADWQIRSVTLDVPKNATTLRFGVSNSGTGQVWIDELTLEAVGADVPAEGNLYSRREVPTL